MTRTKLYAFVAALALFGAALSGPALARKGEGHSAKAKHHDDAHAGGDGHAHGRLQKTKLGFKLDAHHFATGEEVTGTVRLWVRSGNEWTPLAGATVTIWVDGATDGTVVTNGDGEAIIVWGPATDGGHVIKVHYAGDDTHKRARRAQGFHVGTTGEDETQEIEETPTPSESPTEL
ncbi:MAG: Ig-like domain-containing protein [Gaiellales bacterium]